MNLNDIAREAGVSISTVSFYINGKAAQYKISEATCRKIEAVVRKHNFVPNIFARAMKANKTYLIGLIVPGGISRSYWMNIIAGLEEVLAPERYHLVLSTSNFDAETELNSLKFMHSKAVDGYFYAPVYPAGGELANLNFLRGLNEKKPVVWLSAAPEGWNSVCNDGQAGGRLAAQYLFDLRHRAVAYLGHPGKNYDQRGNAFVAEIQRLGGKVLCFDSAVECVAAVEHVTAVFCYSDYFLIDLYEQCKLRGINIPDDLSVIGYDNMEFLNLLHPRPATLNTAKEELGRQAARMMLSELQSRSAEPCCQRLQPELLSGASVTSNLKQ